MSVIEVSRDFGGRTLTLQTGKLAKQADASILATYGETMVLVTTVSSRKLGANQDFFPLTVDFQEKYYAAGRIPGGFFKREAKPSDRATLSARLIDRPIRPLFPEDYLFDTTVTATVLSSDGVNETDFVAAIAASAALHISDIPFAGPVASCRVGLMDGSFILNPTPEQQTTSSLDLLVCGVPTGIVMVEGSSKEVSEKVMVDALDYALESMRPIFEMQEELREKAGKAKREYEKPLRDETLKAGIKKLCWTDLGKAFSIKEKLARYTALDAVKKKIQEKFSVAEPKSKEDEAKNKLVSLYYEELKATYAREHTVNTKTRIDGRPYNQIRNITSETTLLPRCHGSALFTRGETQVLATVTLGTADDEQMIDSISGVYHKGFLLHYNFPPFSVGEARSIRPPGRREIGHGFLAERALQSMLPSKEAFPYTIRIVSEVLESNGSSSMATVCSGSLALMDAGVPIPKPIAGVAMGLIKEGDKIAILSDILGDEDHLGDMDFKVCGTNDGITAFQMDLKIGGVSREIMEQALEQAREGRLHILGKMSETLNSPRTSLAKYAPRIFSIKVRPDKVREVIGSGGKVVRGIIEKTGVKIDIQDDGTINVASSDEASAQEAIAIINGIVEEPEPGKIYEGKVSRIADFGAFVEIIPGRDGLCHISELDLKRVNRVEDVVQVGEVIRVKCLEVDPSGKVRLSRKALLTREEAPAAPKEGTRTEPAAPGANVPTEGLDEASEDGGSSADDALFIPPTTGFAPPPKFGEDDNVGNRSDSGRGHRDHDRGGRGGERHSRGPRHDRGGNQDRSSGYDRGGYDRDRGGHGGHGGDRRPRSAGGHGHDRGPSRGGYDRDRGPSRGGYDRDRGPSRGGYDRDRGNYETRGPGYDRDRGPGQDRDRNRASREDQRPVREVEDSGYSIPYDDDDR